MNQRETMTGSRKKKKLVKRYSLVAMAFLAVLLLVPPQNVKGHDAVSELEITVGYYGMQELGEKEYNYNKKTFSLGELESLGTSREIYTSINRGYTPETIEAEGVYLWQIMNAAGVDTGAVDWYNFFTRDNTTYGAVGKAWSTSELFAYRVSYADAFRDVIDVYNSYDQEDFQDEAIRSGLITLDTIFDAYSSAYTDYAAAEEYEIEPMIALRYRGAKWKSYVPPTDLDFSNMQDCDPYLFYGMSNPGELTRQNQAQMIYRIHIWYDGEPEITVDTADLKGKTGTTGTIGVTVNTPDSALTEGVISGLVYESSNPDVVTVDGSGNILITGEGNADISVSYGGKVYGSVAVNGTGTVKEPSDSKNSGGDGKSSGSGSGTGNSGDGTENGGNSKSGSETGNSGDGTGNGGSSASGDGSGEEGSPSVVTPSTNRTSAANSTASGSTISRPSSDSTASSTVSSTGAGEPGDGAPNDNAYEADVYEITPMQDPVALQQSIDVKQIRRVAGACLLAVVIGVAGESWYFKEQTLWIKHAKRKYEKQSG